MSIKFDQPMNEAVKKMIKDLFGQPQYQDRFISLFDRSIISDYKHLTYLANAAGQPLTLMMHEAGAVVELEFGTFKCFAGQGWLPYEPETWICDRCHESLPMDHDQVIDGMKQYCSDYCCTYEHHKKMHNVTRDGCRWCEEE